MKKLSFIFGFITYLIIGLSVALPITASAATYVSGIITTDTRWTLSDSPYIVTGSVLVNSGITLTIEAGVIVSFDGSATLQIEGTLIAIGTDTDNIVFTSNQPAPAAGDWGYIFFTDSSRDATYDASGNYTGGSILEYCVIEYGGGTGGALLMDDAHPFINYCTIMHNSTPGISAYLTGTLKITNSNISNNTNNASGAISVSGGTAIISNNTISDNINVGISGSFGIATISGNTISNNYSGIRGDGGAITISDNTISDNTDNGIDVSYGTITISDNIISNNSNYGIISAGTSTISYNTVNYNGTGISVGTSIISNNTISNNNRGIYIEGTSTISNNIISNNTTSGDGGGIFVNESGNATISGNTIANNIADGVGGGIYIDEYGSTKGTYNGNAAIINNSIVGNSAENASAVLYRSEILNRDFENNIITGNTATGAAPTYTVLIDGIPLFNYNDIFNNTATYELWNDNAVGTPNVDAVNNWWGTSVESEIQASIYDWFVDISKGIVDYRPYLLSPDAEPEPNISADIESRDFGNIDVSDSANRIFTISNIGTENLAISDLYLAGNNPSLFSIQNDNCSGAAIASLGSCTFEAVFSPTEGGALNALIGVKSNDPDTPALYINLSGIGITQTFTIKAVAGANGSISPSGDRSVDYGEDRTFTITPAPGYQVADVLVDYVSVGPATTYTFSSITSSHTIIAAFAEEYKSKRKQ